MRARSWLVGAGLIAALAVPVREARADGNDTQRAAARGFATDGLKAYNDGKYAEAFDLFTRAEALVHAPPHVLYIARSSAQLGKLVRAKEAYVKIAREELPANAPKAFVEAQTSAATESAALEPRIPKLTIVVKGSGASKAAVTMDGAEVPSALVGVAHPVDPGKHVLHATAPGWVAADATVNVAERASETATITLDQRDAAPVADNGSGAAQPASTGPELSTGRRIAPFAAFGVGVAGLAVGTVFLLTNRSKRDDADAICGGTGGRCPESRKTDVQKLDKDADKAATFSLVGYGIGIAGIAAGAVLLVLNRSASKPADPKTGFTMTPWLSADSAGVMGRF